MYILIVYMAKTIYPAFRGHPIVPTRAAYHELETLGIDLYDIVAVLENGYNCSRSKRAKGKLERCLRIDHKTIRTVVAEGEFGYPDGYVERVYWLIHVSVETYKKRR